MTNPLKVVEAQPRTSAPKDQEERRQHWIDRGNRLLWGQEPDSDGNYLTPRLDLEWKCTKDGHYFIDRRV